MTPLLTWVLIGFISLLVFVLTMAWVELDLPTLQQLIREREDEKRDVELWDRELEDEPW
jgi:hypothetical protein